MLAETPEPEAMEAAAVTKFSEYLTEQGFYFANIADPNKTLFGANVPQSKKSKRIKDPSESDEKNSAPPKVLAAAKNEKLTNYFQLVNAIQ